MYLTTNKQRYMFLDIARKISILSHCVFCKKGSILVKNGVMISQGVNGTPQGTMNCDDVFDSDQKNYSHEQFEKNWEISSEMNCVLNCIRCGISTVDTEMYTTHIPKREELKYLSISGIRSIYYINSNDDMSKIYDICSKINIYIEQITNEEINRFLQ